jgi:hypothetical protein
MKYPFHYLTNTHLVYEDQLGTYGCGHLEEV